MVFFYRFITQVHLHTLTACGLHNRGSSPVSRTKNTIANAMVFFIVLIYFHMRTIVKNSLFEGVFERGGGVG